MHKKRLLVGLCSWNNPNLLKACINSILESTDLNKDGIAVVLNEADLESMAFLSTVKIPFVALPENRGVLAIDYLKPFVENSEYFLNTNDDMLFSLGFADDLIQNLEAHYPASSSCCLVEGFNSGNHCVVSDASLEREINDEVYNSFIEKWKGGVYTRTHKTVSYNHPICVRSKDYLAVGGYSGDWDMEFASGYGRDDMFAYKLWALHGFKFNFVCSEKAFVFHASSATMKKLPQHIRDQNNVGVFQARNNMSIAEFRQRINIGGRIG